MDRFGGGRSDSLGMMAALWPAQAETAIGHALAKFEARAAEPAQLRDLASALDAYENRSYYVAKVLAQGALGSGEPKPARPPSKAVRNLGDLKTRFQRLQKARRNLSPASFPTVAATANPDTNKARTLEARWTAALFALETAFAMISQTTEKWLAQRLLGMNTAIDAFECGLFDDAIEIARDAAEINPRILTLGAWRTGTYSFEGTAARMRALGRNQAK